LTVYIAENTPLPRAALYCFLLCYFVDPQYQTVFEFSLTLSLFSLPNCNCCKARISWRSGGALAVFFPSKDLYQCQPHCSINVSWLYVQQLAFCHRSFYNQVQLVIFFHLYLKEDAMSVVLCFLWKYLVVVYLWNVTRQKGQSRRMVNDKPFGWPSSPFFVVGVEKFLFKFGIFKV